MGCVTPHFAHRSGSPFPLGESLGGWVHFGEQAAFPPPPPPPPGAGSFPRRAKWGVLHPILPIDRVPLSRWGESLGGWVHFGEQAAFPPTPAPRGGELSQAGKMGCVTPHFAHRSGSPSRWGESLGGWVHFGEQAAFPPPPPPPPGAGSYPRRAKWGVLHPILPIDQVPPSRWGKGVRGMGSFALPMSTPNLE